MTGRLAPIVASALVLSACVNMAPRSVTPALSTPAAWDADLQPGGASSVTAFTWRDYFPDPRLRVLIATALDNNRDLMAATARIEQARAQFRIQDSARLPSIAAGATASRSRSPTVGANGEIISVDADRAEISVGVSSFELDFWGRVANLSEAARADYLATVAAQRAFYLSLIGDVASTYFELIETEEQVALAEATVESRREELRIAELRQNAGVTSGLPFEQAQSLLAQAQQQLAAERLSEATLRHQLAVLVGGQTPQDLPEGLSLREQIVGARIDAGLPSSLLLARPDIIAAEENLRAARANIGAARAAFFPTISLTGSTGYISSDLDNLVGSDRRNWSYGPTLSLPIFDWGARRANLDLARAREVEAVANYDAAVQAAFREVADALAARRWLEQQLEAQQRNLVALERIARIARLRYREGVVDYLEVLDAERNLFSARQQLLAAARAQQQNNATLYIALGGGLMVEGAAPSEAP